MSAVIQTEKLTKFYGKHRGHHRRRPRGQGGRGVRLPGAQRRRQDDDDPDAARPHPADQRAGDDLRHRDDRRPGRDPSPPGLPAGRVRAVRQAHRRPDARLLRQPARRRRQALPAGPDRAAGRRPVAQVPRVLEGQQAEDRADHRAPAPARPAAPRRADLRPGPAHPAGVLRRHPRGQGTRAGPSSSRRTSCPRSRRRATAWRSSATAALARVDRTEALRDLAHHQVELVFTGPVPAAEFEALPGVSDVVAEDHVLRMRVVGQHHAGRARRRQVRAGRLRQPRAVARGDLPGRVRPTTRRSRSPRDDRRARDHVPRRPPSLWRRALRLRQHLRQDRSATRAAR